MYTGLLTSVYSSEVEKLLSTSNPSVQIRLERGDHAEDLELICDNLAKAVEYAANDAQRKFLTEYIESFRTGSFDAYRDSQRNMGYR